MSNVIYATSTSSTSGPGVSGSVSYGGSSGSSGSSGSFGSPLGVSSAVKRKDYDDDVYGYAPDYYMAYNSPNGFVNNSNFSDMYENYLNEKDSNNNLAQENFNRQLKANMYLMQEQARLNQASAAKAQKFEMEQAKINREWQEYMSSTSYQRAVADLKKAGLNPVLAYMNSGASTPSGNSARGVYAGVSGQSVSAPTSDMSNLGSSFVGALANVMTTKLNNANSIAIENMLEKHKKEIAEFEAKVNHEIADKYIVSGVFNNAFKAVGSGIQAGLF